MSNKKQTKQNKPTDKTAELTEKSLLQEGTDIEEQEKLLAASDNPEPAEPSELDEKSEIIEKDQPDEDIYAGMSKFRAGFLKCLPLLILMVCIALFILGVKWIAGIFYEPQDSVYTREADGVTYTIVKCYQNPSSTFYIYEGEYEFIEEKFDNVGKEHEDAHFAGYPLVYFIYNELAPDVETVSLTRLVDGNGLIAMQFGEFVLYRLEGQYGVFAPLRDYKESTTSRKNDLYVVRQLMKDDRYKSFITPDDITQEKFLEKLQKIEWYLDAEYNEDLN